MPWGASVGLLTSLLSSAALAQVRAVGATAPSAAPVAAWSVIGGANPPTILQPLGAGRALVCDERRCAIWDHAVGRWTETAPAPLPAGPVSHLRRRDGAVVAIDGSRKAPPAIWSQATGHWTSGPPLPEVLSDLQTAELDDGRIVAGGWAPAVRRTRAYVADPQLRGWSILVDGLPGLPNPNIVPTRWGALLFTTGGCWRYTTGVEGWREIPLALPPSARFASLNEWGGEVLVTARRDDRWTAWIIDRDDRLRPAATLPATKTRLGLVPIPASDRPKMWLVSADADDYLWREGDEGPIPLPAALPVLASLVALDEQHLLGVQLSGAVVEVALDGTGPPGRSCEGLLRYLSRTPTPASSESDFALAGARCRAEVRRGEAPALVGLVRTWSRDHERQEVGRSFECAIQDDESIEALPGWIRGGMGEAARTTCYQSLLSWPAARGAWQAALDHSVYQRADRWWVDPALIRLASLVATPDLRERLVPVVRAAYAHRAGGFDPLRDRVCVSDSGVSDARRRTCEDLAAQHESEWRQQEENLLQQRRASPPSRLPLIAGATAVLAGAVGAAYVTRESDAGRAIAVGAGALGGAALGISAVALFSPNRLWGPKGSRQLPRLFEVGMLAGAVAGGIGAYALASSPASRAPVTAAALALPYLLIVTLPLD